MLRPGGQLMIADLGDSRYFQAQLVKTGMSDVARRRLGWRFWWGPLGGYLARDRHEAALAELTQL